ncbi:leucine-rich repeat domain-containing protein [Ruminococcus callidus]|uniref:leucine-rich repeat domain-containing protein n=1 Tax=Ruminococcus callidus TaxID=40519 RepID=UPI003520A035
MNTTKINTPLEYGFFNCADGTEDRVYTAENFTGYLSAIICDGILDTWGDCFSMSCSDTSLTIGTGYAWIGGHYAILAQPQVIDVSVYADTGLSRMIAVGISCDTASSVRACSFEVAAGLAGSSDKPAFTGTDTKKYFTLCYIKLAAGGAIDSLQDVRNDEALCGYCKCILGKCGVTVLQEQMGALESRMDALEKKMDALDVKVLDSGTCGENAAYTLYTNGLLRISGSGATDDQNETSVWAKNGTADSITKIIVDDGITKIGDHFFNGLPNVTSALIAQTVSEISTYAFADCSKLFGIALPPVLTKLSSRTFSGTGIAALSVPVSVSTISLQAFYGTAIENLVYAGTKAQWNAVEKQTNTTTPSLTDSWDVTGTDPDTFLKKVICSDGTYVRNTSGKWSAE